MFFPPVSKPPDNERLSIPKGVVSIRSAKNTQSYSTTFRFKIVRQLVKIVLHQRLNWANEMIGLWLVISSFGVILFPELFVLRKFERKYGNPFGRESFEAFLFFDKIWTILCVIGFGLILAIKKGDAYILVMISLFVALTTIPTALYSGNTGIYPERSQRGYYYEQYRKPVTQLLNSTRYSELKIVGWVQLIFFLGIIAVSTLYLG